MAAEYSINVWSVKMLEQIGVSAGMQFARNLGISTLVSGGSPNDMGLALALGGLTKGVSPLELTAAYAAFANQGVFNKSYAIEKIEDKDGNVLWQHTAQPKQVMSPETAYLVTSMLETGVEEGTGKKAQLDNWPVAGKTGTTSETKDAWFVGYTPQYVGAVWLGYDDPKEMTNVIGGGYNAGPIWRQVMETAHAGRQPTGFTRPAGIVEMDIDSKSGLLPSPFTPLAFIQKELFNQAYVPTEVSKAWVSEEVCTESGQLATPNCPTRETRVFLNRAVPWSSAGLPGELQNAVPEDANLEKPSQYCTLHIVM
jgi:penicillin-binding protein 1A